MPRFFVLPEQIKKKKVVLTGSDVNHIRNVLRLHIGDAIEILDGIGHEHAAKIVSILKNEIHAEIVSSRELKSEPKTKVALAQAIPKAGKMDLIIQKCTELGVSRIIPVESERVVVKLDPKKKEERRLRWQKIAKEAAEQSGRLIIPIIEPVTGFARLLSRKESFDLKLILWEMETERGLKTTLQNFKEARDIMILIGPEGGFSKSEADLAVQAGFISVSLGKRILRAETAPLAALSMIMYEYEG